MTNLITLHLKGCFVTILYILGLLFAKKTLPWNKWTNGHDYLCDKFPVFGGWLIYSGESTPGFSKS